MTVYEEESIELDFGAMSIMERISLLDDEARRDVLTSMTDAELADWRIWLRPKQIEIVEDTTPTVVAAAGRGAGKTICGASWTIEKARKPNSRIHLIGRTVADVRDVMVTGDSGIIPKSPPDFIPDYMPSVRRLVWPNGSVAQTFSSESPDALRGPQCDASWVDELASFKNKPDSSGATIWDNIKISTRLGRRPQILVTTTPRRTKIIRELFALALSRPDRVSLHTGSTTENKANLSPEYIENLFDMYAGTALEQQELYGILLGDVAGAMWRDSDFVYRRPDRPLHELVTVIGVDPGVTKGGDATGIVVGRGEIDKPLNERRAWVIRDDTEPGLSPERWASRIVEVWRQETELTGRAALVVAEKNQGGELISTVINQTPGGEKIPVALISARVSKAARAEPILLAYRRGRIFHTEGLDDLEIEMTEWEPDVGGWSPNRLDANVHMLRAILFDDSALRQFGSLVAPRMTGYVETAAFRTPDRAAASMTAPWRHGRERT